MTNSRNTKRALFASVLALILCFSMLLGSTFAWFTDSVSSDRNTIVAGNLDVELSYWDGTDYAEVTANTKLFNDDALWEPGHTEVVYLRVKNIGSLALKYQLAVNVYGETIGKNVAGEDLKLSDHLVFSVVEKEIASAADLYTREEAVTAAGSFKGLSSYNSGTLALEHTDDADYVALIIYMPEQVGNEGNHDGVNIPSIQLGTSVVATQYTFEEDSFNDQYDAEPVYPIIVEEDGAEFELGGFSVSVPVEAVKDGATSIAPIFTLINDQNEIPADTNGTLVKVLSYDLKIEGIKEDNTAPITLTLQLPDDDYVGIKIFHNGQQIPDSAIAADFANKTVTFTTTSFSTYVFELDTGATVVPESYTNEEAIAMLKNAAAGSIIDGNGRTITFAKSTAQSSYGLIISKNVTIRNFTFKSNFTQSSSATIQFSKTTGAKLKNCTIQNTGSGKAISNASNATGTVYENCVLKSGAWLHGSASFIGCTFSSGLNMEGASNYVFRDCTFNYYQAITLNSTLKNILFENNTFSGTAFRLYAGMPQPTNFRFIGNTYKTKIAAPDSGVDYEGWKANGAWIEEGNVKV